MADSNRFDTSVNAELSVDELLSEAVRQYPVLYEKTSKDFQDRNKMELAWLDVAWKTGFPSGNYCYLTSFIGFRLQM